MLMVRVRVYRGDGTPVGEIQASGEHVQAWFARIEDPQSEVLHDIRDLVDPDRENENYDWDIWARPAEVRADLEGL